MDVLEYLNKAVADGASDVFFLAGSTAMQKVDGRIVPLGTERLLPGNTRELISEV